MTKWIALIFVAVGLTACASTDVAGYNNDDPQLRPTIQAIKSGNYDHAIKTLRPLVQNGNPTYEHYLGLALIIRRGDAVRQKANKTLSSDTDQAVTDLLEHSMSSPDNGTEEGIQLLTSSANKGNEYAQLLLGGTIITALDTVSEDQPNFDIIEATKWIILADRGGNPDAVNLLKLMEWLMPDPDMKSAYSRANSWKPVQWSNAHQNTPEQNTGDASDRLRKLKELFDDGLISENDYLEKKKEIIDAL